jgi:K+ transporter
MGHIGCNPIRSGWYGIVLLNYARQTTFFSSIPPPGGNLFFRLALAWGILSPMVLASAATVIASRHTPSDAAGLVPGLAAVCL